MKIAAKQQRPEEIRRPDTAVDWAVRVATVAALGVTAAIPIMAWGSLPDRVPVHFSGSGQATRYGPKSFVFFPLVVAMMEVMLLTAVSRMDAREMNLPVRVTEANAQGLYAAARSMFRWLRLALVVMTAVLAWVIAESARTGVGPGGWFVPVLIGPVLSVVAVHIVIMIRRGREGGGGGPPRTLADRER